MEKKVSIGIVDDHPVVGRGLGCELSKHPNIDIQFVVCSKNELFDKLIMFSPDILVMDIVMPEVMSIRLFDTILQNHPEIKIIAYSSLNDALLIQMLMNAGVSGYVSKNQPFQDLLKAIQTTLQGIKSLPDNFAHIKDFPIQIDLLTEREVEVLQLISKEFTSNEIAKLLNISVNTVETHRKTLFQKLNVKNVAGMIMDSIRLGYIH